MKKLLLSLSMLFISITLFSQQAYYNDVNLNLTGIALRDELGTKVTNTHTNNLSYDEARECLKIIDLEPGQNDNVLLIYGFSNNTCPSSTSDDNDHRLRNKSSFGGGTSCEWNREHVYAKSQGTPALGTSGPGADAHHLRAADVQRNGQRGHLHFVSGSGNSGSTNGGWYPGDEWKGDVARMIMYMYIRYGSRCLPNGITIGNSNSIDSDMVNILLDWNAADPVAPYEDVRNTYLGNSANTYGQGNRNPFIDEPYLATLIWGGTPAEDRWGIFGSSDTESPSTPTNLITSNPTSSTVDLNWDASTDNIAVSGYDIYVDGSYDSSSVTNSHTSTGLASETTYTFTVLAKDAANNTSAQSASADGTTLAAPAGGSECASETFENIPDNINSYSNIAWTGDNGLSWNSTNSRTDQTINNKSITVRGDGVLTAPTTANGIKNLTVTTKLVFSGSAGTFDLKVNGVSKGSIPYSSTEQTTTINNIDVAGNVTIIFDSNTSGSNRVIFDDLTWTCFSALAVDDYSLSKVAIYPNPTSGNELTIAVLEDVTISVFDILGKQVLADKVSNSNNQLDISRLNSGMYLIRLETENGSATKKFIKK